MVICSTTIYSEQLGLTINPSLQVQNQEERLLLLAFIRLKEEELSYMV